MSFRAFENAFSPQVERRPEGARVLLWRTSGDDYDMLDLAAELPDGTVVPATRDRDHRFAFPRPLPQGTFILLQGQRAWGPLQLSDRPSG